MESALSSTAWRIAQHWASGRDRSQIVIRGLARQAQDHLDHGADPDHLHRLAGWASAIHPDCLDLDLAMRLDCAPRPEVLARAGHPCLCRGSTARGGAPAPAIVRQLIRRPVPAQPDHRTETQPVPDALPAVRFACITDPTKRHAFFCATATEAFDRLAAAFDGEDVTVQPYEFTDPRIVAETHAWIADAQQNSDRPPMVMVGSIEDGQWVNWQLPTATRPPVPSL